MPSALTWINRSQMTSDKLAVVAISGIAKMRYLTIEQRESLELALKQRAGVLAAEIASALRQKDTPESLHLANRFEECGEAALAELELALDIASVDRDMTELRDVLAAQGRVHSPEYGVCEACNADIPFSRLQAEPGARRCIACQRALEHASPGSAHSSL